MKKVEKISTFKYKNKRKKAKFKRERFTFITPQNDFNSHRYMYMLTNVISYFTVLGYGAQT